MDSDALRRIDARVGVPLCAVLTLHRRLTRRRRDGSHAAGANQLSRVLVIKLAEQGASVVAGPALQRLTSHVGREGVWIMVFAENRPVLDEMGPVDADHILSVRTSSFALAAFDVLRALRRLRRIGVDGVLDLEFFSRASAAIGYLSGARRRVGFHSYWGEAAYRGDLLTDRLSFNPRLHTADAYSTLVEVLVHPTDSLPAIPALAPHDSVRPRVALEAGVLDRMRDTVIHEAGVSCPSHVVLLNPNASDLVPLRRWPEQRYVELARRLLDTDPSLVVVLTGTAQEQAAAAGVQKLVGSRRCVSMAGRTSLHELLALYEVSDVLVTNDSGPAHFAQLTGVDVVVLFGPESPAVFGPRGDRAHVLWAGLPCSPCVHAFNDRRTACTDNLCMQAIDVDSVLASVLDALAVRSGPPTADGCDTLA